MKKIDFKAYEDKLVYDAYVAGMDDQIRGLYLDNMNKKVGFKTVIVFGTKEHLYKAPRIYYTDESRGGASRLIEVMNIDNIFKKEVNKLSKKQVADFEAILRTYINEEYNFVYYG